VQVGIDATLTGPRGNQISGSATDGRTTFTDVFWQGSLKWHEGVHNTMIYATGNIPSGTYDPNRLANLSLGFVAVDGGAGYTYLDTKSGNEFSVAAGLTYSFSNPDLQYQNGIDFHLDWGASKFVEKNVHVGMVGYSSSRSLATAARVRGLAISKDACLALDRKSGPYSRRAKDIRATSISRATGILPLRTGRMVSASGRPSRFLLRRPSRRSRAGRGSSNNQLVRPTKLGVSKLTFVTKVETRAA